MNRELSSKPRLLRRLGVCLCVALIPRPALAHGGSILLLVFWEALVIPWAVVTYWVAGSKLTNATTRSWLGPLTLLATVIAIVGGWFGVWALGNVIGIGDPTPMSPLILVISGAPGVWSLWRQRSYQWALALLLIPLALTGSCGALAWSAH